MAKKKKSAFRGKTTANAQKQRTQGAQYGHLSLPKGVNVFKEEPNSRIKVDFMPYKVTDPKHPDRDDEQGVATPGDLWYKRPYRLHRNIGANDDSVVCPSSIGMKCPICEYRARRLKEGAEKEELRELNASLRNLYVVIPKDHKKFEEKPHIWDISQYLFQNMLNEELGEDEDYGVFPDLEEGLTLRVRFGEGQIGKNKFAETSRIDFLDRDEAYDESILDDIPDLDKVLTIKSYAQVEALFMELDEDAVAEEGESIVEEEETPKQTRRKPKPKPEPDPDEQEAGEPEPVKPKRKAKPKPKEEDEKPEPPPSKLIKETGKTKPKPKPKEEVDGECPFGHTFGTDCEEYEDCDNCDEWDACMDAKEKMG